MSGDVQVRFCERPGVRFPRATHLVIGIELPEEADMVLQMLRERMARYGLQLHPEKTRLVPFERPARQDGGKGPGTFDFLGFTLYWRKTKKGHWGQWFRTRKARLQRAKTALDGYCRRHRHEPVKEQHASLCRRINGHINYFSVNGNLASVLRLLEAARRIWYKWLKRRSSRSRLNWQRFNDVLRAFPLPRPRVRVQLWAKRT